MKFIIILIATLMVHSAAFSADSLTTNITKATVFLSGAQVFRQSKTITVKKGVNEFIVKDVSPYLVQQQIQATAKGSFLILDVQYQTEYVAPPAVKATIVPATIQKEINRLNDTILFISFENERITSKLENLNNEKTMVKQNQLIKGGGISDTLPELKSVVEYYRVKLDDINELLHKWKKKQHIVSLRQKKHQARLNELNNYSAKIFQPTPAAKTRYHILVTTYSDVATSGKVEVNYFVNNAGWVPAYDLRANNTNSPMIITYKAHVYQNTGEDWENVNLILSTYDRTFSVTKPEAGTWRLDYTINKPIIVRPTAVDAANLSNNEVYYSQNAVSAVELGSMREELKAKNPSYQEISAEFQSMQSMAAINQNFSNVEFNVALPYSIKADGSQKLMVVMNEKVDANFYHFMLPRMNKYGFLQAKIGDWENMSLLPGKANIYFNQTFVGSTTINPSEMSDTMELTMGRDQAIVSKRKKISEEEKFLTLKKRRLVTRTFEIEVRNNSRASIELTLEDLIPVTKNEDITIKIVDGDGSKFDEVTGKLIWKLSMKAGEKKILHFTYSIEHERGKPVS
jgi:uncharacterized protein (TIGR02231 family)